MRFISDHRLVLSQRSGNNLWGSWTNGAIPRVFLRYKNAGRAATALPAGHYANEGRCHSGVSAPPVSDTSQAGQADPRQQQAAGYRDPGGRLVNVEIVHAEAISILRREGKGGDIVEVVIEPQSLHAIARGRTIAENIDPPIRRRQQQRVAP